MVPPVTGRKRPLLIHPSCYDLRPRSEFQNPALFSVGDYTSADDTSSEVAISSTLDESAAAQPSPLPLSLHPPHPCLLSLIGFPPLPAPLLLDSCPICSKSFTLCNNKPPQPFWQHINSVHISRSQFPPSGFITRHNRLVCSSPGCHWLYHSRLKKQGCQRRVMGSGKCGGAPGQS